MLRDYSVYRVAGNSIVLSSSRFNLFPTCLVRFYRHVALGRSVNMFYCWLPLNLVAEKVLLRLDRDYWRVGTVKSYFAALPRYIRSYLPIPYLPS